jgi:hypothetical protein
MSTASITRVGSVSTKVRIDDQGCAAHGRIGEVVEVRSDDADPLPYTVEVSFDDGRRFRRYDCAAVAHLP